MLVPLTWLREYCDPDLDVYGVEERLTMTGTKVEAIRHHGVPSIENFVVGRVLAVEQHPDADRLRVCSVDLGRDGEPPARIVCGGANNQLAHPGIEKMLADRGILYAPDYLVNSGGLIQVADELEGFSFDRAKGRAEKIFDTTRRIFTLADEEGVPPVVAADRVVSGTGRNGNVSGNSSLERFQHHLLELIGLKSTEPSV